MRSTEPMAKKLAGIVNNAAAGSVVAATVELDGPVPTTCDVMSA
jgi:hypothetical protein